MTRSGLFVGSLLDFSVTLKLLVFLTGAHVTRQIEHKRWMCNNKSMFRHLLCNWLLNEYTENEAAVVPKLQDMME